MAESLEPFAHLACIPVCQGLGPIADKFNDVVHPGEGVIKNHQIGFYLLIFNIFFHLFEPEIFEKAGQRIQGLELLYDLAQIFLVHSGSLWVIHHHNFAKGPSPMRFRGLYSPIRNPLWIVIEQYACLKHANSSTRIDDSEKNFIYPYSISIRQHIVVT